jgi:hypothetical protein
VVARQPQQLLFQQWQEEITLGNANLSGFRVPFSSLAQDVISKKGTKAGVKNLLGKTAKTLKAWIFCIFHRLGKPQP